MRFSRLASLVLVCITAAPITGCNNDIAGPQEPEQVDIVLPPFSSPVMRVAPNTTWWYGNSITFYAPVGVAPQIDLVVEDLSVKSPKIETEMYVSQDQSLKCIENCTRAIWNVNVNIKAGAVGEAKLTLSLKNNPSQKTSARIVSSYDDSGKG